MSIIQVYHISSVCESGVPMVRCCGSVGTVADGPSPQVLIIGLVALVPMDIIRCSIHHVGSWHWTTLLETCLSWVRTLTNSSSGSGGSGLTLWRLSSSAFCCLFCSLSFTWKLVRYGQSGMNTLFGWGISVCRRLPIRSSAGLSPHQGRGVAL